MISSRLRWLLGLVTLVLIAESCGARRPALPPKSSARTFVATAYCRGKTTASGVDVRRGIIAADPSVLPLGTWIRLDAAGRHDGVYHVMDTGPKVRDRRVDLFIADCSEAVRFGRQSVRVTVLDREPL